MHINMLFWFNITGMCTFGCPAGIMPMNERFANSEGMPCSFSDMEKTFCEVVQLCSPYLELQDICSLCQVCKQLLAGCLDVHQDQLNQWLMEAVKTAPKTKLPSRRQQIEQDQLQLARVAPIGWFLKQYSKTSGLISLSARLNLQEALLEAGGDPALSVLLISAGARFTQHFLLSAAQQRPTEGPIVWVKTYAYLGLTCTLHAVMHDVLLGMDISEESIETLFPDELADIAALALSAPRLLNCIFYLQQPQILQWSSDQVYSLLQQLLSPLPGGVSSYHAQELLTLLINLPGAEEMGEGAKLQLVETVLSTTLLDIRGPLNLLQRRLKTTEVLQLFTTALLCPRPNQVTARCPSAVFRNPNYVNWPLSLQEVQPLLELAIRSQCSIGVAHVLGLLDSKTITAQTAQKLLDMAREVSCCRCWKALLQVLAPLLVTEPEIAQQLYLSCGGAKCSNSIHGCAGCELVSSLAIAACKAAAAKLIPVDKLFPWELYLYEASLTHLSAAPAAWQLLQQAPHDIDTMQRVLLAVLRLPSGPTSSSFWGPLLRQQAAINLPPHVVQQLLEEAIERKGFAAAAVGPLLKSCAAAKDLPWVVVEQLLQRCIRRDAAELVELLLQHLPAVKDAPQEWVYQMLQLTQQAAPACLQELFRLVSRAEDMPYSVQEAFMGHFVESTACSDQQAPCTCGMCLRPASCMICDLLRRAPGLPAAALLDALRRACTEREGDAAGVWVAHEPGFALAPGIQELSEEQVLEVLLPVIPAYASAWAQPGPARKEGLPALPAAEGEEEVLDYSDDDSAGDGLPVVGSPAAMLVGAPVAAPPPLGNLGILAAQAVAEDVGEEELLDYEEDFEEQAGPVPVAAGFPAAQAVAGDVEEELLDFEEEEAATAPAAAGFPAAQAVAGDVEEELLDFEEEAAPVPVAAGIPAAQAGAGDVEEELLDSEEEAAPVLVAAGVPAAQAVAGDVEEELLDFEEEAAPVQVAAGVPAGQAVAGDVEEELLDFEEEATPLPVAAGVPAAQAVAGDVEEELLDFEEEAAPVQVAAGVPAAQAVAGDVEEELLDFEEEAAPVPVAAGVPAAQAGAGDVEEEWVPLDFEEEVEEAPIAYPAVHETPAEAPYEELIDYDEPME
jgi:hypothetical protein